MPESIEQMRLRGNLRPRNLGSTDTALLRQFGEAFGLTQLDAVKLLAGVPRVVVVPLGGL